MTAGMRLREFKFVFDVAPALPYSLDTNSVPAPVQALLEAFFVPRAREVLEDNNPDNLSGCSKAVATPEGTDTEDALESFNAEGEQFCGTCCISCSSLEQLHEHFNGLGHRRQAQWFVDMDADPR